MATTDLATLVPAKIRALRLERGMTQEELCERARISIDAVNRIESGSRSPSLQTLERLARALRVTPAELVSVGESQPRVRASVVQRIVTLLDGELPETQAAAEKIVRILTRTVRQEAKRRRSRS